MISNCLQIWCLILQLKMKFDFMRKKKLIFIGIILSFVCSSLVAQTDTTTFKPSGKIITRIFADYSAGLNSHSDNSGFDITRALLGYNYRITPTLQARVVIDGTAGHSTDNKLEVYLRNAYLNWCDKGFDVYVGEIGMLKFATQEKFWGHRYVMKSFQDDNKMSASVDIGLTAKYTFAPNFSADLTIVNGEGYKEVNKDNSNRYGLGLTYQPITNITLRAVGDLYNESVDMRDNLPEGVMTANYANEYSLSLFGGYKNKIVTAGVEYAHVFNRGFIKDKEIHGFSVYSTVKIASKWQVYARYDNLDSSSPSNFGTEWNDRDGQAMIAGVQFQPLKQLKISPNFRNFNPDRDKSEQYIFINLEFNL